SPLVVEFSSEIPDIHLLPPPCSTCNGLIAAGLIVQTPHETSGHDNLPEAHACQQAATARPAATPRIAPWPAANRTASSRRSGPRGRCGPGTLRPRPVAPDPGP